MYTFQDGYEECQRQSGDYSAKQLIVFKRDLNQGGLMFMNRLNRKFSEEHMTTDYEEGVQYYQLPGRALRIAEVKVIIGDNTYHPQLIPSEEEWNRVNTTPNYSMYPIYYYVRGFNEIGIYPIPSDDQEDALEVSYEPQHRLLTQNDFKDGSITVEENAVEIIHSGSGFTPQMVGRRFEVLDGTDAVSYRIAAYVSTDVMNLENYYEGISGDARPFRIGEVMKIPAGYEDAGTAHALWKYWLKQKDAKSASIQRQYFKDQLKEAQATYGKSTARRGVKIGAAGKRQPRWIDMMGPISYP